MKYLVHAGTGTIINADDDVFVLDTALLDDQTMLMLTEGGDEDLAEFAQIKGKRLSLNDMTYSNTVSYSPSSIREEIRESLSEYYTDEEWLSWAEQASDDDLNEVAGYILSADDVWQNFSINLVDGLREGYRWSKEREGK